MRISRVVLSTFVGTHRLLRQDLGRGSIEGAVAGATCEMPKVRGMKKARNP